jgi:MotA/TolQ/ExbB proton channel family protein
VRRRLIQIVLPFLLCAIPVLAAGAIAAAIEFPARKFYLQHITALDKIILGLGASLFVAQMLLTLRALRWRGTGFDERPDPWLSNLAQAAEWFPLLGLLGTVAGILQTFGGMEHNPKITPREIIGAYAPAITATGSGLLMALINIFPTWTVNIGRDLIRTLGGGDEPAPVVTMPQDRAAPRTDASRRPRPTGSDAGHR